MKEIKRLSDHLKNRISDLAGARNGGNKVIGYTPGGYMPEELVLAAGAIPLGMIKGGDPSAVALADAYICRWLDPFCRSQIGYAVSGTDPYYSILDLLAVPVTDNHIRAVADVISYNTRLKVFPFGVPHMKEQTAHDYYLHGLVQLRIKLEAVTGNKITDQRLAEAILLCNRERELFRRISELRKKDAVPISGSHFVALHHASFLADKRFMVEILESLTETMAKAASRPARRPRILLTGSTLAQGDHSLLDMIEDSGGIVVMEEFAECIRPYWEDISIEGDPLAALADGYFQRRVPPAWFRPGQERRDFIVKLAREWRVDGVIWYQLMMRESYKTESYYFQDFLQQATGLPLFVVESDYEQTEAGPMRTRVETFLDVIGKGGR
jgi:benzoyl-CoA reductase/2-hydroxyglutaryl-CoA dehydratase subunit BcrC/BadD/HgdB